MITKYYKMTINHINNEAINECARLINDGKLVAFPTETVYGLGANALNVKAINNIFTAKGRPNDNPLILHVNSMEMAKQFVDYVPDIAYILAKAFWPGPLTMIFNKKDNVPYETTAGLDTVAIRIPSHPVALALITSSNCPIAAPSANSSGRPSTTEGSHVIEDLNGKIDAIIDCGRSEIGLESTVLDLTSAIPVILRPGGISFSQLSTYIPDLQSENKSSINNAPKAPGMKYKHYAPKAPLYLVRGSNSDVVKKINELSDEHTGILCVKENMSSYTTGKVISLGSMKQPATIAHNLFDSLRKFDKLNVSKIYCEYFEYGELKEAVINRLKKAANHQIITI